MNFFKDLLEYLKQLFTWWIVLSPWENGIRVTLGKKMQLLTPGFWVTLPLIHRTYIQSIRLRVMDGSVQTLTTKDGLTVTMAMCVGYTISDVVKLYETLQEPGNTIANIAQGEAAQVISTRKGSELSPSGIERIVTDKLNESDFGIRFDYCKITTFAMVKTYRLIGDKHYISSDINMNPTPH